jgi:hypothetical protein
MVVEAMDKMLPEVPDKPLEQQSDSELFAGNFRRSLLFSRRVLDRPDDWDNVEFMKTKREVGFDAARSSAHATIVVRGNSGLFTRVGSNIGLPSKTAANFETLWLLPMAQQKTSLSVRS